VLVYVLLGGLSSAIYDEVLQFFLIVAGFMPLVYLGLRTDVLVVQRAVAADSMAAARRTPLIAAMPKMLFPFLVILPGLIALSVHGGVVPFKMYEGTTTLVLDSFGKPQLDYDLTIPTLLLRYFPTGMLGLGLTALLASFMSGMAGNVTAFNTVWTYDIYQAYLKPKASDAHYLWIG